MLTMIAFPPDGSVRYGEHVAIEVLPRGGRVRWHARLRPAPDFATIVERTLAGEPRFLVSHVGVTARLVTLEGEYGAWVAVEGTRGAEPARWLVGAVFTEDFACALDAQLVVPALFDELGRRARELLLAVSLCRADRPLAPMAKRVPEA